jgi:hypothetical protein
MHCLKLVLPQVQLYCRSISTCHRRVLPVCRNFVTSWRIVLFGTSLSGYTLLNASRIAANYFDGKLPNVQEWTYVLLANTPRSHLHSFCATGVSSGLATWTTLTRVSREKLWEVCGSVFDLIFVPQYVIVVGLHFKWYTLYKERKKSKSQDPKRQIK